MVGGGYPKSLQLGALPEKLTHTHTHALTLSEKNPLWIAGKNCGAKQPANTRADLIAITYFVFLLSCQLSINNDKLAEWLWRVTQAQAYRDIPTHSHGRSPRGFEYVQCLYSSNHINYANNYDRSPTCQHPSFFALLLGICILNWIRVHCFCYNVVPLLQYQVQLYQIHLF